MIYRYILGDTQREGSLTHGRTSGDDHQVGRLPSGSHIIHLLITGRNTRKSALVLGGTLQDIHGILDHRINLGVILLHITLRELEKLTLGMLHEFIYIHTLIIRLSLDVAGIMDELSLQIFLRQDSGMVLDMGSRSHLRGNLHQVTGSTHLLDGAHLGKFIRNGHDIHGALLHIHGLNRLVDFLMSRIIKGFGFQHLGYYRKSIGINHQCTQNHFFQLHRLRLQVGVVGIYLCFVIVISILIYRHTSLFLLAISGVQPLPDYR